MIKTLKVLSDSLPSHTVAIQEVRYSRHPVELPCSDKLTVIGCMFYDASMGKRWDPGR